MSIATRKFTPKKPMLNLQNYTELVGFLNQNRHAIKVMV